jgi:RHH-type rel operon transcriptional repressor/antitoxin RelB
MLAIRLPEEIEKRISELAKKTGRTKTYYVKEAILQHLSDLEDYYLAVDRIKENEVTFTQDQIEKDLGILN